MNSYNPNIDATSVGERMSLHDVTPWIRGNVKPVRPGVYEREFPHRALFAEWTGYQWLVAATTVREAQRRREVSLQQDDIRWRGLAGRC